jgi:hypothetical protein
MKILVRCDPCGRKSREVQGSPPRTKQKQTKRMDQAKAEINSFDKSKLKPTSVAEKSSLPTKDQIAAAKSDPNEKVALPADKKK